jgi:hypothetical protein
MEVEGAAPPSCCQPVAVAVETPLKRRDIGKCRADRHEIVIALGLVGPSGPRSEQVNSRLVVVEKSTSKISKKRTARCNRFYDCLVTPRTHDSTTSAATE